MLAELVGLGAEVPYGTMGPLPAGDTFAMPASQSSIGDTIANAINAASKAVITGKQTYDIIRHPPKPGAPMPDGNVFIPPSKDYTPWLLGGGAAVVGLGILAVVMMGGRGGSTRTTIIKSAPAKRARKKK